MKHEDDYRNVVFLTGMHGSGKDTIKNALVKKYPDMIIPYEKCEMTKFTDVFERQVRRVAKYVIDYDRIHKLAKENPNKIILADRCLLDAMQYITAFHNLGKINDAEFELLYQWLVTYIASTPDVNNTVFLIVHPSFKTVMDHLKKRQSGGVIKWNETDMQYNKEIYSVYNKFNDKLFKDPLSVKFTELLSSSDLDDNIEVASRAILKRYASIKGDK